MKTTALALATLLALSGTAFAGETHKAGAPSATCVETTLKGKIDCTATGSVEKTFPAGSAKTEAKGPRLGIDVNPWIMPSTF